MSQKKNKQEIYAANLQQDLGYPLRSPNPNEDDQLGLWIGDVGHVNEHGQFEVLWNICHGDSPSGIPSFERIPPVEELIRSSPIPNNILTTGVEQDTSQPSGVYKFTTTSETGAILILPSGATLYELQDQQKIAELSDLTSKHALAWCRYAKQDTLYLITGVCKARSWTLGSFHDRSRGRNITIVEESGDKSSGATAYKWNAAPNLDHQSCSKDDMFENQTVTIRGFRMKLGQENSAVVERVEGVQLVESVEHGGKRKGFWASKFAWITKYLAHRRFRLSRRLSPRSSGTKDN